MTCASLDAISFDKDVSIFDSEQVCCGPWLITAKAFGADFAMHEFVEKTSRYISQQHPKGLPIKKGFERFFRHIFAKGVTTRLVTSASHDSAVQSFQQTDYLDKFKVFVSIDDVSRPKPDAECYLLACQTLGWRPEPVLVFENSNAGIQASIAGVC